MLVDLSLSIMFLYIMLLDDMSCPIMLRFIMLVDMSWFIMLRLTIWEDITLFMLYMSRPMLRDIWLFLMPILLLYIMLLGDIILYMSLESSLREEESMKEVILVWMRSGSTERLSLLVKSASSLMMWKPWLSAM